MRLTISTLLIVAIVASADCSNPLTEAGFQSPKDPGTVTVRVVDEAGAPVVNAHVSVTQPNNVGSFFSVAAWTDANGTRTFSGIPAGDRPVTITPPAGYKAGADGLSKTVTVTKGKTTTAVFVLVHDTVQAS